MLQQKDFWTRNAFLAMVEEKIIYTSQTTFLLRALRAFGQL